MLRAALLIAVIALPMAAEAQTYRCTGKDGKKYYGATVPAPCLGQPVEQLNAQGLVTKRFDAAASAAEREKKAADDEERKKREAVSKEEGRRNRALLATYTSEKDIEAARARALEGNQQQLREVEARLADLKKRRTAANAGATDTELNAQEGLLAAKRKEAEAINHRFDEDRKRYVELTKESKK